MKKHNFFDYHLVIKYSFLLFTFLIFNSIEKTILPYSSAIFISALYINYSLILCPILYILSFILLEGFSFFIPSLISSALIVLFFLIYKKLKRKPVFILYVLSLISILSFLFLGKLNTLLLLEKKFLVLAFNLALTIISMICAKTISIKGLKFKPYVYEIISLAFISIIFGVGFCNLLSPYIWKGIVIFLILSSCYLFRFGIGTFISAILSISFSIYYNSLEYIAVCLLIGISCDILCEISRFLSALSVLFVDFLISFLFNVYGGYSLVDYLPVIIASLLFSILPTKPLSTLKNKLNSFREKQLVRHTINRNRTMLSNKLYELSNVFNEMSIAFNTFKEKSLDEQQTKERIIKKVKQSICENCDKYSVCKKNDKGVYNDLNKIIDVGFAKGKVSVIDISNNISANCVKQSDILFFVNKSLAEYRLNIQSSLNLATGRELISEETKGVSEILKGLALESGSLLKYQGKTEKILCDNLLKNGFNVSEILIYGEGENTTISMILSMKEFSLNHLINIVNKTLSSQFAIIDKTTISEDKYYVLFKINTELDAVFGISMEKKDNSTISGDTHSIVRISDDKFLVAISDGMGSGEKAQEISSISLSLIESFYKAGMKSDLILNTVNKLLSINAEDSFSALDISVIDLKNKSVDFIKYGSPYGYIINEGGIKIVEANTLPMGIIKELKPSVCSTKLNDGDMILLTSDGISDAFGNSNAVLEYIRRLPAKNPQTLSDSIIKKALELSHNKRKDDMTVLAVRIYKKDLA
ncbi:MAG: SpoIIE family protein phosphatase [Clostridia bacterium]|nr:SpoIIE family protein phosphatase [Clostridia bacterium]